MMLYHEERWNSQCETEMLFRSVMDVYCGDNMRESLVVDVATVAVVMVRGDVVCGDIFEYLSNFKLFD